MKKFLIALAASAVLLGGQTQAAPVDDLNAQIEIQEMSDWPKIRDKLLGRDHHDRDRYHPPRHHYHDRHHHDKHHHRPHHDRHHHHW